MTHPGWVGEFKYVLAPGGLRAKVFVAAAELGYRLSC